MPYRLRWEGHGVYRRFFGKVSSIEFRKAYEEMKDDLRYECTRYIISDFLEAEPGPDIVHATVGSGEPMLAHVRYFESMPLAPYPEATFETVQDARRWIASNPRPAWRLAAPLCI